jgi:hypothetical protein
MLLQNKTNNTKRNYSSWNYDEGRQEHCRKMSLSGEGAVGA